MEYYIAHHGIQGQKWGVRRYQNADGSLTPAGQKRLNREMSKIQKHDAKIQRKEDKQAAKEKAAADKWAAEKQAIMDSGDVMKAKKYISQMSNDEINYTIAKHQASLKLDDAMHASLDHAVSYVKTVSEAAGNISKVISNGSDIYNGVAKAINTFQKDPSKRLPIIGEAKKYLATTKETVKEEYDEDGNIHKTQVIDKVDNNGQKSHEEHDLTTLPNNKTTKTNPDGSVEETESDTGAGKGSKKNGNQQTTPKQTKAQKRAAKIEAAKSTLKEELDSIKGDTDEDAMKRVTAYAKAAKEVKAANPGATDGDIATEIGVSAEQWKVIKDQL